MVTASKWERTVFHRSMDNAIRSDDAALAIRLDRSFERLLAATGQLVTEELPEVDELRQVIRPQAGIRVGADDRDGDAPSRARASA